MPDRCSSPFDLARQLQAYLTVDVGLRAVRELGWFDFLNHDRPSTLDPREMACAALLYMLIDESGNCIRHDDSILLRVLAFTTAQSGTPRLDRGQIQQLQVLLSRQPVNHADVCAWFLATFPAVL